MVDISQEEMRYILYEKKKLQKEEEYIAFEKNQRKAHGKMRNILKPGLRRSVCCEYPHIPLEYFNLVVEGKEESLSFPALECNMPLKGGAQEHFTLTNCSSCQEKMKQTAIKCSNEDADTKEAENKAQIKGEHKNVDDEEDIVFEDSSSEDADNPDKTSESEEESNTDEELERKKTSEIEDARSKDWEREYIVSTTCTFCKQIFPGKKHRKQHEKRNHSEKFNHYNCKVCDKKFTNSTALNYHLSIKHGETRILVCQGCKKELNSFKEYLEHKKTHRESYKGMDAQCDKCGIRISRKQMKRHHKNVH